MLVTDFTPEQLAELPGWLGPIGVPYEVPNFEDELRPGWVDTIWYETVDVWRSTTAKEEHAEQHRRLESAIKQVTQTAEPTPDHQLRTDLLAALAALTAESDARAQLRDALNRLLYPEREDDLALAREILNLPGA